MRFAALAAAALVLLYAQNPAPIRFEFRPLPFVLENSETARKHLPETMPGGVAVFDYDNDGDLDIYFANGASMPDLKKSSAKYRNRLFRNDGAGAFTDVTASARVAAGATGPR